MKTIRECHGVSSILYPDSQPQVSLQGIDEDDDVRVIWPVRSSLDLLKLMLVSNALSCAFAKKRELVIPYLLGARSDRLMNPAEAVPLKVIADMVNYCEFEKVVLFDPHSDVAGQLINRSVQVDNRKLVEAYSQPRAIVICPDAGAAKKITRYQEWNENLVDVLHCVKHRDLSTGVVELSVLEKGRAAGRNCVVIDDLCDGGATFLAIAGGLAYEPPAHLTLIVTHGIFSKGTRALLTKFNHIITSDSYFGHAYSNSDQRITVIPFQA